jgi:antitoxin component YwqK of YwqJK toxin-antitoxin module
MKKTNLVILILAGILAVWNLANGQTIKTDTCYFSDRNVCSVYTYVDGARTQRDVLFKTGELQMRATYDPRTGQLQGTEKWFYRNGQLKEETQYSSGLAHGWNRKYLPDGALISETLYVESRVVPNGEYPKHFARR